MKTVAYTPELFTDVVMHMLDYYQISETVCGSEDPAVITLTNGFAVKRPELAGYGVVRVTNRFVSPWKSDTFLEFSNDELTAEEYEWYEERMDELAEG